MKPNSIRRSLALSALAAAACVAVPAGAQPAAYPSKPVTIVVAYPAGGDSDALARLIGEKLSPRLGQPVLIDNRPGASGVIGSAYVSRATPDGHTLLLAPNTLSIAPLVLKSGAAPGYDVLNGFTPIIRPATQSMFIVAAGQARLRTITELVAAAKGPKPLSYASPGTGSPMHVLGEMFARAAGVRLTHVPYKGVAPAVNDVAAGHVPVTFMTLGPVAPHMPTGKLVPLAVASKERSTLAPQVPTLRELGIADVEVDGWTGLWGPRGMSPELAARLNEHVNEILRMPDVVAKLAVIGMTPHGGSPDVLRSSNAAEYARYAKLIKDLNIEAE